MNTGKNRINLFVTLGSLKKKRLATIQGAFICEKWLNLNKNSELCKILTCPIPIFPTCVVVLRNNSLETHGGDRMVLECLQSTIIRGLSLFDLPGRSLDLT